jgi:hypothetical protein
MPNPVGGNRRRQTRKQLGGAWATLSFASWICCGGQAKPSGVLMAIIHLESGREEIERSSLITQLCIAVRAAWVGDRIDVLTASQRYQEALTLLERELAKYNYPPSWRVLELQLHHFLGHDAWVVDRSCVLLREVLHDKYLKEHDRRYLSEYVSLIFRFSGFNLSDGESTADLAADYASLDLSKVSSPCKRMFPMTTHPLWEKYKPVP